MALELQTHQQEDKDNTDNKVYGDSHCGNKKKKNGIARYGIKY